jgi:DNA sulfur modification protein DndB
MTTKQDGFFHSFPAIRGNQAGSPFYIAMCPMHTIPKIFVFDEEEVPPDMRAQRTLNRNRIPDIASYLIDNPNDFILSALTASINSAVEFEQMSDSGPSINMGTLHIPMDAFILINDGQHRRAAIEEAIKENPDLRTDKIPVLFFIDVDLKRSQQMFADLNKHAVRPSTSLGTLYDYRDQSSEIARYLAFTAVPFKGFTELEKASIGKNSKKLFTLSSIKYATRALLKKNPKDSYSETDKATATAYWEEVAKVIPEWQEVLEGRTLPTELRETKIHAHAVALQSLGNLGAHLLETNPKNWKQQLQELRALDWSRENKTLWGNRALVNGRVAKGSSNLALTTNLLKITLGLELNKEEVSLEKTRSMGNQYQDIEVNS